MHAVASHNYLVVEGDNIQHRVPVVVSPRNVLFGRLTGGEIASTFDNPGAVKLGRCKLIEEIMIGEDRLIHFSGTAMGEACTIVLRGASESPSFYWQMFPLFCMDALAGALPGRSMHCFA